MSTLCETSRQTRAITWWLQFRKRRARPQCRKSNNNKPDHTPTRPRTNTRTTRTTMMTTTRALATLATTTHDHTERQILDQSTSHKKESDLDGEVDLHGQRLGNKDGELSHLWVHYPRHGHKLLQVLYSTMCLSSSPAVRARGGGHHGALARVDCMALFQFFLQKSTRDVVGI